MSFRVRGLSPTPFRDYFEMSDSQLQRHAIYVARSSDQPFDAVDVLPEVILTRLVSVRAFDERDMMIDADVVDGARAAELFDRLLSNPAASYLQVHNAKRGCYSSRVERA
ncbi:MAG TPA: DUF1203 domain-containing protein [Usitatibacter sp.]|jgi:hypothetical protein